jgi:L-ribulokinase
MLLGTPWTSPQPVMAALVGVGIAMAVITRRGIAVAVANVDAHVSAPAAGAVEPGSLVMVMGTSTCHVLVGDEQHEVEGMCGVVADGVVPGLYGYEAGQPAVGDLFAWFAETSVPPEVHDEAQARGVGVHVVLEEQAARLAPGESGVLALDWWNGNRSVLVDADLSGVLVGLTLRTRVADVYRALIEATAFGTRVIVDAFEAAGVPVRELVACGGLPQRNKLLMQIYADVTGRPIEVAASEQAPALGSAIHAAVAAGAYPDVPTAAKAMGKVERDVYRPDPDRADAYDPLYAAYRELHDYFGQSTKDSVLHRLRRIRNEARGQS